MASQRYDINVVVNNLKRAKELGDVFKDAAANAERLENKIKAIQVNLNRAKEKFNVVNRARNSKGQFVGDINEGRNQRRNASAELRMQRFRQLSERKIAERRLAVARFNLKVLKAENEGSKRRAEIEQKLMQV